MLVCCAKQLQKEKKYCETRNTTASKGIGQGNKFTYLQFPTCTAACTLTTFPSGSNFPLPHLSLRHNFILPKKQINTTTHSDRWSTRHQAPEAFSQWRCTHPQPHPTQPQRTATLSVAGSRLAAVSTSASAASRSSSCSPCNGRHGRRVGGSRHAGLAGGEGRQERAVRVHGRVQGSRAWRELPGGFPNQVCDGTKARHKAWGRHLCVECCASP
jgi:hypothetical protein